MYHRFADDRHPSTNISTKVLEQQFKYLKSHGYKVVNSKTLLQKARNGENVDKLVAFHIDDSFKSFYKNGFKIFKKYHYPFTLFVYVEGTDKHFGDFMSWRELREIAKYDKADIQCHSYAHPHLPKLSTLQVIADTQKALELLRARAYKIDSYAYPYGEYDARIKKILAPLFTYIYNQNAGGIDKNVDFQDVNRIALTHNANIAKKLQIKNLNIQNIHIKRTKDTIKEIRAITPYKQIEVYITGWGWRWIKTKNHILCIKPNFTLRKFRNRIVFRVGDRIKTILVLQKSKQTAY
ncbi:MAG: polysaccharide deacetylase family protein [Epsilonproteobacteria bacterium]|nr:polysaccharide deacetylase family protein [Campylobacterota bacterium]